MHISAGKLYNLLKRANPKKYPPEVQKSLKKISQNCSPCLTVSVLPLRFKATTPPDDIIFNRQAAMDLMWLDNQPVLDVVEAATNFQNAVFLKSKSTTDIWKAFFHYWTSVYIAFPKIKKLEKESSLSSRNFRNNAKDVGVDLQFSGIE